MFSKGGYITTTGRIQNYNNIKIVSISKPETFLEALAEAKAEEGDLKKEIIIKQLMLQEFQRKTLRQIKYILGRFRQKVSAIETPVSSGEWKLQTTKDSVEQGCIDENIRQFEQVCNTPLLREEQIQLLG
jgi:hypothetical protein